MIAWLILVLFTAAFNLFVFIAARGRWGRLVPLLAIASLAGTVAGNEIGRRLGLDLLRIGSFELVAASVAAQLAMLATLLLAALAPAEPPPA
ncbi:MAG: hypothetical protein E6I62_06495 [Chloroflexi bacterium]|jgi:hypothetical protein|nr:MAG: hypothetical protein E6I62_06495 [Chloroflexota bacterium]